MKIIKCICSGFSKTFRGLARIGLEVGVQSVCVCGGGQKVKIIKCICSGFGISKTFRGLARIGLEVGGPKWGGGKR